MVIVKNIRWSKSPGMLKFIPYGKEPILFNLLDLVGRKMTMKKGSVSAHFMQDMQAFYEDNKNNQEFTRAFANLGKDWLLLVKFKKP